MEPIDGQRGAVDFGLCPRADATADLNALVDLAAESEHPIVIVADGREVGLVTKRQLFRGIQGRT
jgi:glycine betaine/proline transport system ATP-binding protein